MLTVVITQLLEAIISKMNKSIIVCQIIVCTWCPHVTLLIEVQVEICTILTHRHYNPHSDVKFAILK